MARITQNMPGQVSVVLKDGRTVTETKANVYRFDQIKPDRKRSIKPKGILPPKPYSFSEVVTRPGFRRIIYPSAGELAMKVGVTLDQYSPPTPVIPAAMEDRAVTKALLKLKNQRINLGVAMAEAQKTANMLGDISSRIARGVSALRRKKGGEFWQAVTNSRPKRGLNKGSVPRDWLAYQYGIVPLLADVKGAWDELQSLNPWQWVTVVRGVENESYPKALGRTTIGDGMWGEFIDEVSLTCKVSLAYMPMQYALQSIARTGISNPFAVLWETTPFSFVVDQVLPLGDCLNSLDATVGWEFLHGSCTKFSRVRRVCVPEWVSTSTGNRFQEFQSGIGERVTFNRSVYGSSPLPRPPHFESPLSLRNMANGMALLSSAFYGKQEQMESVEREAKRATRQHVRESVRNYRRSSRRR